MLYFANPSTPKVQAAMMRGDLGCILTPRQGNRPPSGALWCADNGCGPTASGQPGRGFPGDEAYLHWLCGMIQAEGADPCDPDQSGCLFAVAPDVLGSATDTLQCERTRRMLGWIRYDVGVPVAFVAQNGQEHLPLPWDDLDVIFLGGSAECTSCGYVRPWDACGREHCASCHRRLREWKLGAAARGLVTAARRRGKWVHMGRVNSLRRLRYAAAIGCDSADGTYLVRTRNPDRYLPAVLGWQRDVNSQGLLW